MAHVTDVAHPIGLVRGPGWSGREALGSVAGWSGALSRPPPGEHPPRTPPHRGLPPAAPAVAVEEEPVKRTYQPKKQRRARRHGFRHRMATRAGRAVVRNRRQKGRAKLSA